MAGSFTNISVSITGTPKFVCLVSEKYVALSFGLCSNVTAPPKLALKRTVSADVSSVKVKFSFRPKYTFLIPPVELLEQLESISLSKTEQLKAIYY